MNAGSKRITIRIGEELLALVQEELDSRNRTGHLQPWTVTDYVLQAVAEKLSHARRSRKEGTKVTQVKVEEFRPREVADE